MLRPSKLFVPFHQLRHFLQSKIAELVNPPHLNPPTTIQLTKNIIQQPHTQSLYHEIQRHIGRLHLINQPTYTSHSKLMGVLRQQFPIVKVFSAHSLTPRPIHSAWYHRSGYQLRTMMSSSGGTTSMNSMALWGFPRTMMAGRGHPSAFHCSRQFSTTKSPCVSLFQNNHAQQNVFSHLSTRMFTPAAKMTSTSEDKKQPPRTHILNQQEVSNEVTNKRLFNEIKGIGEVVHHCPAVHHPSVVTHMNTPSTVSTVKKLDHIVHHDNLPICHSQSVKTYRKTTSRNSRRVAGKKKRQVTVYMAITLDSQGFNNYHTSFASSWSTENLNTSFIHTLENMVIAYQKHMSHVVHILNTLLQLEKGLRVIAHKNELRVYFPTSFIHSKQEALQLLSGLGISHDPSIFTIIEDYPYFFTDEKPVSAEVNFYEELDLFLKEIDSFNTSSRPSFAY